MTKEQLMKLAEFGARERLKEIQAELNELAKNFPHIVGNQDGSVPAVLPISTKKPNGKIATYERRSTNDRLADLQKFLVAHPGADTKTASKAIGVGPSRGILLLHKIAKGTRGGHKKPSTWVLKKTQQ